MGAFELRYFHMDHFSMFVQVALLRKSHLAVFTNVWLFPGMGSQVVEVLAHREYGKIALFCMAMMVLYRVLTLEELVQLILAALSQEEVNFIVFALRNFYIGLSLLFLINFLFIT